MVGRYKRTLHAVGRAKDLWEYQNYVSHFLRNFADVVAECDHYSTHYKFLLKKTSNGSRNVFQLQGFQCYWFHDAYC